MSKAELEQEVRHLKEKIEDLEQTIDNADDAYTEMEAEWANERRKNENSLGPLDDMLWAMQKDGVLTPQLEDWLTKYQKGRLTDVYGY